MDIMDNEEGIILFVENRYYKYAELVDYLKKEYLSVDLQKEEKPSYKTNPIFNHLPVNVLRGFQRYSNSIESGIKLMTEIQEIDPDFYRDLHKEPLTIGLPVQRSSHMTMILPFTFLMRLQKKIFEMELK